MSDILPIDPATIEEEPEAPEPPKVEMKVIDNDITDDEHDIKEDHDIKEEKIDELEVFEKPEEPKVVISKITGKPKRKCSEKKLLALKKAQEASRIKRLANKEKRDLEKAKKRADIAERKQKKVEKEISDDVYMDLRAKIYKEEKARALKDATWDEDRLTKLMEKTIGNFLDTKKKQKPVPKAHIPHPMTYPQMPANHPSNQQQQFVAPQQHNPYIQQQPYKPVYTQQQQASNDVMTSLFGFNQ